MQIHFVLSNEGNGGELLVSMPFTKHTEAHHTMKVILEKLKGEEVVLENTADNHFLDLG